MKKYIAILLLLLILVALCGCRKNTDANSSDVNSALQSKIDNALSDTDSDATQTDDSDVSNSSGTIGESNSSNKKIESVKPESTIKPVIPTQEKRQEKTENGNDVIVGSSDVQVEDIPSSETIPEQEVVPEMKEEIVVETNHIPLAADKYYQYSSLNTTQKKAYNAVVDAIKATKNIINISRYNISREEIFLIIEKVFADHPEYFYVSRYTSSMYDPTTGIANTLVLYYTDGKTIDKFEKNRVVTANNRENISKQIKEFNQKVEAILNKIPTNCSQIEKERIIHDYIIDNARYDYDAAENMNSSYGSVIPHAWDVYGALVEGRMVCEGYSKAIVYLCHCVGINATTVSGYSENERHMWNAVQIENEWYMLDATWNDAELEVPVYTYFNITTIELESTHIISTELIYPNCTSNKNTFINVYTLDVVNDTLPSNYKTFIDTVITNKEKYLILNIGSDGTTTSFLRQNFVGPHAPVIMYFKEKGYMVEIQLNYLTVGNLLYLTLVYK